MLRSVSTDLFLTNLFTQAVAVVFVPVGAHRAAVPVALGYVAAAFGLGAILGAVAFTTVAPHLPRYPSVAVGFLIGGAPRLFVLALTDNLLVVIAVTFLSGVSMCAVNPAIQAMVYQRVPTHLMARVAGISMAVMFGGLPLGGLAAGVAVQVMGFSDAVLLLGVLYLAATLVPVVKLSTVARVQRHRADPSAIVEGDLLPRGHRLGRSALGLRATLVYTAGDWRVSARDGLRPVAFRRAVEPKIALEGLTGLGVPAVREAVREALADDRTRLTRTAQRLRSQLARWQALSGGDHEHSAPARRCVAPANLMIHEATHNGPVTAASSKPTGDPDRFVATPSCHAPWSPHMCHAGTTSALLMRAMEAVPSSVPGPAWVCRFAAEILHPVPVGEVTVAARIARPGRSVELIEAELAADGQTAMVARAWRSGRPTSRCRRSARPWTGRGRGSRRQMAVPPVPPEPQRHRSAIWHALRYAAGMDWRFVSGSAEGGAPALVWARPSLALVAGEPLSPVARVVLLADTGNGLSRVLDVDTWWFINIELTVHLHRPPVGEWVLLAAKSTVEPHWGRADRDGAVRSVGPGGAGVPGPAGRPEVSGPRPIRSCRWGLRCQARGGSAARVLPAVLVHGHRGGGGDVVAVRHPPHRDLHAGVHVGQLLLGEAEALVANLLAVG